MFEIENCQRAFTKQGMPIAHLKTLPKFLWLLLFLCSDFVINILDILPKGQRCCRYY